MNDETYDMICRLVHGAVTEHQREQAFRKHLIQATEDERCEIAYLLHDLLNTHPQAIVLVPFSRVETYIGRRLKIAHWQVRQSELDDEFRMILDEMEDDLGLLDDDDDRTAL